MATDTREYDTFGPWVPAVLTEDDVPPLFRSHPLDLDAARLVLKVPRDIARRDATPGMDLYDHLLALETDHLTVLSRRTAGPGGYDAREVAYGDVVAVLDVVSLLDGRLQVHTRDGQALTVAYNGSGADKLQVLVDELRTLTLGAGSPADGREPQLLDPSALGRDDVGVVSAHREVAARRPQLRVLAAHGRRVVTPRSGALRRLAHVLTPMTLQAGIVAGDQESLEVFGRREWLVRGRGPVRSLSRLVLPRHTLDRVEAAPHPRYAEVTTVAFVAGGARLTIAVPAGSTAEQALTA